MEIKVSGGKGTELKEGVVRENVGSFESRR